MKITGVVILCGLTALSSAITSAQTTKSAPAPKSALAPKPVSVTTPAPASQLLASARRRAGKQHKNVLVMFHSSWCGWCKRLEGVMNTAPFDKLIADNYVIVSLDVSESGAQKVLENPGADTAMANMGGARSGLPFYAFLDAKGTKLADSNVVPGANGTFGNIGYPATSQEIAAFDALLKKTAPNMKIDQRQNFIAYLTRTSPAHTSGAG